MAVEQASEKLRFWFTTLRSDCLSLLRSKGRQYLYLFFLCSLVVALCSIAEPYSLLPRQHPLSFTWLLQIILVICWFLIAQQHQHPSYKNDNNDPRPTT